MGMIEKKLHRLSTKQGGPLAFDYLARVLADQAKCTAIFNMLSDKDMFINPTLEFGAISADSDQRWTPARRVNLITRSIETSTNTLGYSVIITTGLNLPPGNKNVYTFNWNPDQTSSTAVKYSHKSDSDSDFQPISYKPFAKAFAEVIQHANGSNYRVSFRQ